MREICAEKTVWHATQQLKMNKWRGGGQHVIDGEVNTADSLIYDTAQLVTLEQQRYNSPLDKQPCVHN